MNVLKAITSISAIFILGSCNHKHGVEDSKSVIVHVLTEKNKKIEISNFIDNVEYVALEETCNNLLGGIDKLVLFNDQMYVLDSKTKKISVFDLGGESSFQIDNFGKGPGEYLVLNDFNVNKSDSSLEIWDSGRRKIIKYDRNGDYLSEISLDLRFENFIRTKDNLLLCYTCNYPNYEYNGIKEPYNFYLIDNDGNVLDSWMPIEKAKNLKLLNENMFCEYEDGVNSAIPFDNNIYHISPVGLNIRYMIDFQNYKLPGELLDEYSRIDTDDKKARSLASIQLMNNINSSNYALSIHNVFENSKFLFFQYSITQMGIYTVIFDKRLQSSYVGIPNNDVDHGLFGHPIMMDENYLYLYAFPYEFSKLINREEEVEMPLWYKLVSDLDDQANPVLIRMHFK